MNKFLLSAALVSTLFLAGCNEQQQIITTQLEVVEIPEKFKDMCPAIKRLPNVSTLTDKQVADLVVRLWQTNQNCRTAILGIYEYQKLAKSELEKPAN